MYVQNLLLALKLNFSFIQIKTDKIMIFFVCVCLFKKVSVWVMCLLKYFLDCFSAKRW